MRAGYVSRVAELEERQPRDQGDSRVGGEHTLTGTLTPREVAVLRLVAEGLSNAEIAGRLFLGEETVKTHVSRMLRKLRLCDRTQTVIAADESGLVTPA
jgi:DNA-binding NarL/FixJ family response regulator